MDGCEDVTQVFLGAWGVGGGSACLGGGVLPMCVN